MRIGIDIRTADPPQPGQQRYLWRLGAWLGSRQHDVSFLTVRPQQAGVSLPPKTALHRLDDVSRAQLRSAITAMRLDVLLLNPERSRRYRGIRANVLRAAYGTDHYRQKLRSFSGAELAMRRMIRMSPWELAERQWERDFYRANPDVIAQSAYMKREITDTYGVPDDRIHVIHNAVDTREFSGAARRAQRAAARVRFGLAPGEFCLLFVGHNFRLKGLWPILKAISSLSNSGVKLRLLVLGRGTGDAQRDEAQSLIRSNDLEGQVILAGENEPVIGAYAAADALLHLTWHDSFGFVVLEAMACGLPVVTTKYAGASEIIEHGTSGLIVEPQVAEIASAIMLLADESLRARMGLVAANVAGHYTELENFKAVERVFEIAASRGSGPVR
jgi:UDP-glucose:(heptosyl)LPS alpha-1,3-glucosyltransferase